MKKSLLSDINLIKPISGPVNQTVTEGNLVTLHCQFTARDKARVSWLKEGIPIEFSDNDRYYATDGDNLQIKGTNFNWTINSTISQLIL